MWHLECTRSNFANSVDAYCDMTTDGGGWIVIQRNKQDNVASFNRNWTDYEEGFGDLNTEFRYGLKPLYYLTDKAGVLSSVTRSYIFNKFLTM